jgi:hypothetical protein
MKATWKITILSLFFLTGVGLSYLASANEEEIWDDPTRPDIEANGPCANCEGYRARTRRTVQDILRHSSPMMRTIARNAKHLARAGRMYCYRAVKRALYGSDKATRGKLNGGSAIDAMKELPRAGYTNGFPHACKMPGVVLVYKGPATGMSRSAARRFMRQRYGLRATAGDIHGHIEILGDDGRYHHFNRGNLPINHPRRFGPWRRQLVGCFIK